MTTKTLNIEVELKKAIKAEKALFGERQARKAIIDGKAKVVVLPQECAYKGDIESMASLANIEVQTFEGNSYKLGSVCERQHAINAVTILK